MNRPRPSMYRALGAVWILGLAAACAPALGPSSIDAPGRQSALFSAFPEPLFDAVGQGCQGKSDTLLRPSPTELVCESLPSPQAAAALILQFNGDIEMLPTFITTLTAQDRAEGVLVTTEYFYRVPQRSGEVAVVRFRQPQIEETVRRVFASAGGRSF
ncbi:MAG: hypothetical protein AAGF78_07745 [Pseudomonadota bacterium]